MRKECDFDVEELVNEEGNVSFIKIKEKFSKEVKKNEKGMENFDSVSKLYLLVRLLQYNNNVIWIYDESVKFKGSSTGHKEMILSWEGFEEFVFDNC